MRWLTQMLTPPEFDDRERTQTAGFLYAITFSLSVIFLFFLLVTALLAPQFLIRLSIFSSAVLMLTVNAVILTRLGKPRAASIVLVTVLYLVLATLAYSANGVHSPAAISFCLLVFIAGFLLGERWGVGVAIACIALLLLYFHMELRGVLPPPAVQHTSLSLLIVLIIILVIIAFFQWIVRRNIRVLLDRASGELMERKQTEQKLSRMFDTIPDAIILSRMSDGLVVDVNPGFERIFGFTRGETIGRSSLAMDTWVNPQERAAVIEAVRRDGSVQHHIITFRRKDGAVRSGSISCKSMDLNGEPHLVFILEDVTEMKAIEGAMRENESKFTTTFHNAPVLMTISSLREGRFIEVNERCLEFTGFTPQEVVGHSATELGWITEDVRAAMLDQLRRNGRIVDLDLDLRRKDGTVVNRLYSCEVIMIGGEQCLLSTSIDITERKRHERERQHLEAQLLQSQKMESIGRLAGGLAHDFNNMLTPILGYSDMLLRSLAEDDARRQRVERIIRAAESSKNLVMNLLAFARKQTLETTIVDINDVLQDFSKIIQHMLRENVRISWRLEAGMGVVIGDPAQLEQVVMNLCVNAHDAMPEGGSITVETTRRIVEQGFIVGTEAVPAGAYVVLTVADTGSGIDPAILPSIFDPFFTTKEKGKGTGLGLSSVYGIVKQHKGSVTVESVPGNGTTFRIYLPLSDEEARRMGSGASPAESAGGNESVLVAEDQDDVRQLVADTLQQAGYAVTAAATVEEAEMFFRSDPEAFDLIVTDVIFTDGNGTVLYDRLAEIRPGFPVLFISGYSDDIMERYHTPEQRGNFLPKPFTPAALLHKVRTILSDAQ